MAEVAETKPYQEIEDDKWNFLRQFRVDENEPEIKEGVTPTEVLGKLDFKEVPFETLDPKLQEGVKQHNFWGHPLKGADNTLLQNADGTIIYSINLVRGNYDLSRITKSETGYRIHKAEKGINIASFITTVSYYEIGHKYDAKHHPFYQGEDIVIGPQEAREQIIRTLGPDVLGLA